MVSIRLTLGQTHGLRYWGRFKLDVREGAELKINTGAAVQFKVHKGASLGLALF